MPLPRAGAIESISSKKRTVGAACLALRKVSLVARSDSPTHLERNSGPFTEMKFAWLSGALPNGRKGLCEGGSATVGGDLRKVYVATDQKVVLKYLSSRGIDLQQTVTNFFSSIPNRAASIRRFCPVAFAKLG